MRDTQASASVGAVRGSSLRGPRERATNPPPVRRRHRPSTLALPEVCVLALAHDNPPRR